MKVYEIGLPDNYDNSNDADCDCTLWIATDRPIKQISNKCIYIKEISEYNENTPGIDFIIN